MFQYCLMNMNNTVFLAQSRGNKHTNPRKPKTYELWGHLPVTITHLFISYSLPLSKSPGHQPRVKMLWNNVGPMANGVLAQRPGLVQERGKEITWSKICGT